MVAALPMMGGTTKSPTRTEEPSITKGCQRMRRISTIAAACLLGMTMLAPAASATAEVCYSATVTVNGDEVVNEEDCVEA